MPNTQKKNVLPQNKKIESKRIEELSPLSLPPGFTYRQFLGTGATPEQIADMLETATGCRMKPGLLQAGMRQAAREADGWGDRADAVGCLGRSNFPALEKAPATLLARLIQNRTMRSEQDHASG